MALLRLADSKVNCNTLVVNERGLNAVFFDE